MKRKVNLVGQNTLTISLPSKWVEKHQIQKGDELEIEENGKELNILKRKQKRSNKEISINLDLLDNFALAKVLISAYENGYDTININFSKNRIGNSISGGDINTFDAINMFIDRLLTFEVVSQTKDKVIIKDISEKIVNFDIISSRVFFLIEEYLNQLIEDIKTNNKEDLKAREYRHDTIAKYTALSCRMTMENTELKLSELTHQYLIFNYLDKATDFIRYSYKNTESYTKPISKESIKLLENGLNYLKIFRKLYKKFSYDTINKLDLLRGYSKEQLQKIAKKKPNELIIVSNINLLTELMNGAIKSIITLNLR